VLDNFSPHLSTRKDQRVSEWAEANNVEFAYMPFYASWLNRIEAQFTALRYSPSTAPTTPHTLSTPG
jgi:transposase